MLLSIIIPVYKVEDYIEKCLQSIVDSYTLLNKPIEVIVVDDGSPDNSGQIADRFARDYFYIKVIHKENAGVAAARNKGIQAATGKWLYFVDSDDWVAKDAIDIICQRIEANADADILLFDAYQNMPDEEKEWKHFSCEMVWNRQEEIRLLQRGMLYFPSVDKKRKTPLAAPWDKVYRREALKKNQIFFREELRVLDDMVFNMEMFGVAQKVVYYKDKIYHYRYVPDSITNQYRANRIEQDCAVWAYLQNYMNLADQHGTLNEKEKEAFRQAYYCRIVKSFSICTRLQFFHPKNQNKLSDKIRKVKEVLKSEPYAEAFHKAKLRNAEWKLKVMIGIGRLRWGYGVYLLYLAQNKIFTKSLR